MSVRANSEAIQWRIGTDLIYQSVDAAKERLLDLPAGSLAKASLTHCMHPEDAAMLSRALTPANNRRSFTNCTVRYVCPKGTHTVTSLNDNVRYFSHIEKIEVARQVG